ncbi:serine hydrolase domain-containing protein [Emticicia agri]|uniref:Class C beta-lactamase-related serine hydrolase n=1 Tax=Emticicia agri TaxID=2492393 RepID=A0A4Q5M0D3_9BACT|nr:serine hydrolase [Emticicia agri]RYU95592.1 class C beta-lactamase-related serine hydrolase [Emticicia agri]
MKTLITIIALCASTAYAQQATSQANTSTVETATKSLDNFIEDKVKESGMVGLGAAIIVNKEVVWMKGYGYADKESNKPFTTNTIMNIGSISKTFTGVALMRAVEEKKLSLDEDINQYLPFKVINPYCPNEKITLRHLATHTSGIADAYPTYDSVYHYGGDSPVQLGSFLKSYFEPGGKFYSKENFLNHKPGTYREYSNIGAGLAGYIVEIVTGKKLNVYTKQHIFKPLKMNNTGWFFSEINLANHSKLYDKTTDKLKPIELYGEITYPDGSVRTSVSELSKFFIALLNEGQYKGVRLLKKASVDEMLRFHYTIDNKPENIELNEKNAGIFWSTKMNTTRIGHGGSDPGVKTEMLADLSKEVAVIIFTNTALPNKEMGKYFYGIYDELHKTGEKIKDALTKP